MGRCLYVRRRSRASAVSRARRFTYSGTLKCILMPRFDVCVLRIRIPLPFWWNASCVYLYSGLLAVLPKTFFKIKCAWDEICYPDRIF